MIKQTFPCEQAIPILESDGCSVYQFTNETGEGVITFYDVFPGVMLSYNDFHMQYYDSLFSPDREIFCIDHCREGRLEYTAKNNAFSYVEAGDLKLDRRLTHVGRFDLPLSHYHGATVTIDMETAIDALPHEIRDFPVNLRSLQEKYCTDRYPAVLQKPSAIEHIFGELYAVPQKIKQPYFKIKILELLLYLDALELPQGAGERPYFYKTQVEKIKAIWAFLTEHMDESYTQEELSERFAIPMTPMKKCFKSVFGSSIGNCLLQYRMNQAAVMLQKERKVSVSEIAGRVGYDSASKFAIAFRKVMGMSPTEYRGRIQ